jgi:hypothetical protein
MIPYIFAGNSVAVATGREIYGYPKEFATLCMPERAAPADEYTVRGLAVACHAPAAPAMPETEILRCSRVDRSVLAGLGHAARELGEDVLMAFKNRRLAETPLALMAESVEALLTRRIDLVYLRQMRALCGGAGCDMQMVTTAREDPLEINGLRLLRGRYELTLPPLDSHPIAADLGLSVRNGNKVDVLIGAEIDLAFTLSAATSLWPPQID